MSNITPIDNNTYAIDAYYGYPLHACVYLVEDNGEYALIDCGTAKSEIYIMGALAKLGVDPQAVKYILPTHVHLDHAGGTGVLSKRLPNAKVYVHPYGHRHLIDPTKLNAASLVIYGEYMMNFAVGKTQPVAADICYELEDNQELSLGNNKLLVQFTPGHAKHHCSFFDPKSGNYFGGDVLGNSYESMRSDDKSLMFLCSAPIDYNGEDWHNSLDKIASLSPKRVCLCHYGAINNPQSAFEDMHRLIDKNDRLAMDLLDIEDDAARRKAIEQMIWGLFWDEFATRKSPMHKEHAEKWMEKDVYISTEGIAHWLKNLRKNKN